MALIQVFALVAALVGLIACNRPNLQDYNEGVDIAVRTISQPIIDNLPRVDRLQMRRGYISSIVIDRVGSIVRSRACHNYSDSFYSAEVGCPFTVRNLQLTLVGPHGEVFRENVDVEAWIRVTRKDSRSPQYEVASDFALGSRGSTSVTTNRFSPQLTRYLQQTRVPLVELNEAIAEEVDHLFFRKPGLTSEVNELFKKWRVA